MRRKRARRARLLTLLSLWLTVSSLTTLQGCSWFSRLLSGPPAVVAPELVPKVKAACRERDRLFEPYKTERGMEVLERHYQAQPAAAVADALYFKACHRYMVRQAELLRECLETPEQDRQNCLLRLKELRRQAQ